MTKLLPIDECEYCYHMYFEHREPHCMKNKKAIPWDGVITNIPDWCPLEDTPDTGKEE